MVFEAHDPRKVFSGEVLVLDNSVAMRWLVASAKAEDQRYAHDVRDWIKAEQVRVIVPYLWVYEAAHVVARYVSRGNVTHQVASDTLVAFEEYFTIMIGRESPNVLSEFAQAHDLSGYDAAYVLLAKAESAPLATLDGKMKEVAGKLGIDTFERPC